MAANCFLDISAGSDDSEDQESSDDEVSGKSRYFQLEENAFGLVALTLTGTKVGKRLWKFPEFFLMFMTFFFQAMFIAMICSLTHDEYKEKITKHVIEVDGSVLEKSMRVVSIKAGMVDPNNIHKDVGVGTHGVVAQIDAANDRIFFQWDPPENLISSIPRNSWPNWVKLVDFPLNYNVTSTNVFDMWRYDSGGGNEGAESGKPWAYWACKGEDWSWAESVIDNLAKYNGNEFYVQVMGITDGELFGLLSLFVWAAKMAAEIRRATDFLHITHTTFDDKRTKVKEEMDWKAYGTRGRSYVRIVLRGIFLLRWIMLGSLLAQGVMVLSHTDNLKDFIFNSIALAFVTEIPEFLFKAFASNTDITALAEFNENYSCELKENRWIVSYNGWCWLLLATVLVLACFFIFLLPYSKALNLEVYRHLCAKEPGKTQVLFE